jgi:hypothetical protein
MDVSLIGFQKIMSSSGPAASVSLKVSTKVDWIDGICPTVIETFDELLPKVFVAVRVIVNVPSPL